VKSVGRGGVRKPTMKVTYIERVGFSNRAYTRQITTRCDIWCRHVNLAALQQYLSLHGVLSPPTPALQGAQGMHERAAVLQPNVNMNKAARISRANASDMHGPAAFTPPFSSPFRNRPSVRNAQLWSRIRFHSRRRGHQGPATLSRSRLR
jgi:hypothetical protein